jgi:hypothetical protein
LLTLQLPSSSFTPLLSSLSLLSSCGLIVLRPFEKVFGGGAIQMVLQNTNFFYYRLIEGKRHCNPPWHQADDPADWGMEVLSDLPAHSVFFPWRQEDPFQPNKEEEVKEKRAEKMEACLESECQYM